MAQQQQQQQWSNNYPNYIDPYGDAYTNQFNYSYQYLQQQYQQQAPYPYRYGDQAIPPQHSYVHDLEHQTQQRQALGAAAAATLTSTLRPSATVPERSAVSYADIASKPNGGGSCCYTWFHSAEAMQQHQSKHQKCHLCSYEAVKVLVEDHLYHTHGIGKKKTKPDGVIPANAPKLDTPEAIEAWIAARKKNYPTAANIERKKKEAEAKGNQQQQKQTVQSGSSNNGLVNYESDDDDDDDDPEKEEEEENDLIDETRDAVSSKDPSMMGKRALPEEPRRAGRRCRYFAAGYCRHGDQCNFVHEKPPQRQKIQSGPRHNQHHQRQPNLLRKLLDREIKQEQSVILQCLRYIVDNDFFGHGK